MCERVAIWSHGDVKSMWRRYGDLSLGPAITAADLEQLLRGMYLVFEPAHWSKALVGAFAFNTANIGSSEGRIVAPAFIVAISSADRKERTKRFDKLGARSGCFGVLKVLIEQFYQPFTCIVIEY